MDYMSMHDWFYGPPEPTWILPSSYDPAPPRTYELAPLSRMYAKLETAEPRSARMSAYEPPDQQQLRRMYAKLEAAEPRSVRTAYEPPDQELRRMYVKEASESPRSASYYHLYPKVQTAADTSALRTPAESRRARTMVDGEESGAPLHISKEMKRKDSQLQLPPTSNPFRNLPIELKVPMCCEKCAKKVYDRILDLPGVEDVVTDQYNQKVIVTGNVDPSRVLNRVKQVKRHSVFWDQNVEYSQVYLKKKKDREMAMIQSRKQTDSSSSSSSAASTTVSKGRSSSLKALDHGKLESRNTPHHGIILPEHETRNMKQLYHSREDGTKPNVRGMILPKSNPQRTRMYEAREDSHHMKPGPNVHMNLLPESDAIPERMPDYESESSMQYNTGRYQSPLEGYRQELQNAAAALEWEDEEEELQQHHNRRRAPAEYAPYDPYVRN